METATKPKTTALNTWDELINFFLMTIMHGRLDSAEPVITPISKCEELENTWLKVENYEEAEPDGLKFHMPLEPGLRVNLQSLLINAKAGADFSFITASKHTPPAKLKWSILRSL